MEMIKWVSIRYWFYKLMLQERIKTAYHEAGHLVMNLLFVNDYDIGYISINKNFLFQERGEKFHGLVFGEWKVVPTGNDLTSADKQILVALASFPAQTIHRKGNAWTRTNFHMLRIHPNEFFVREGTSGDWEIANGYSRPLSNILRIQNAYITTSALDFATKYFLVPEVWKAVEYFAEKVLKSRDLTLFNVEIIKGYRDCGLEQWVKDNGVNFLSNRHPIKRQSYL